MAGNPGRGTSSSAALVDPIGQQFEYDVAISYAGEDRSYAVNLASKLEAAGIRVFFDSHQQVDLWGTSLHSRLDEIYAKQARFVVILASRHYGKRRWTIRERNAIRRRLFRSDAAGTILPITIGIRSIPGLPEALTHVDIREGIDRIVEILVEKLNRSVNGGRAAQTVVTPSLSAIGGDTEQMNTHHAQYSPHSPPQTHQVFNPQPTSTFDHMQGHAQVDNRTSIRKTASSNVDNTRVNTGNINTGKITNGNVGVGALGLSILMSIMASTLGGMAWLAFDFVKHAPRNSDGSVSVWGITLPAGWVGDVGDVEGEPLPPPDPVDTSIPGAPTRMELEGVWACDQNATVTFTEAGRVAIANRYGWSYPNTPFATWRYEPYQFISPRTMVVGGVETHIELSGDGNSMRIIGGKVVFKCHKETF